MSTSTSQERKQKRAPGTAAEAKSANAAATATSTLIEFPGVPPKPQWRKELSERVREIQQRRALEAAHEAEASTSQSSHISYSASDDPTSDVVSGASAETSASPLGLVPPPPVAPQPNPLVVAALKRIERARQQNPPPPVTRGSRGGAATAAAVAHVVEENYQAAPETELIHGHAISTTPDEQVEQQVATIDEVERPVEAARTAPPLVIVPPAATPAKTVEAAAAAAQTRARRHIPVVADEASLSRMEEQMHAAVLSNHVETPEKSVAANDHAPVPKRIAGGIIDLLVVGFASTPFAAIIELTSGNWADTRVAASMGGIVVVLMFLYLMAATALAGRTWGMSLVSLRTVDARTGMSPTTGQCVRRAFGYMLSLATLGIGLLYALFDAEGRAAHDHLSGTIVILD